MERADVSLQLAAALRPLLQPASPSILDAADRGTVFGVHPSAID
jgi:hypothetical protein